MISDKLDMLEDLCTNYQSMEIIKDIRKDIEMLERFKTIVKHQLPEQLSGVYFICGEGGEKDSLGLPDRILVCPAFGADITVIYKK